MGEHRSGPNGTEMGPWKEQGRLSAVGGRTRVAAFRGCSLVFNKMHCSASPVPFPVLQTDYIFATVPNLRKDSANVSNGADGALVIVVFHGW